jgi:hypothetical protein
MLTAHLLLLLLAAICFLVAARPPAGIGIRFEWLGALFVVLSWVV